MFVDFDEVFNSNPQSEMEIPPQLMSYLNSKLPVGVHYVADENGNCIIESEGNECSIGGIVFEPTVEHKKILGESFTHQDVLNYFYNAQKKMPLKLKKEGYILLNGEEIAVDKLSYSPLNPVKIVSGSFWAFPHPFPAPFKVKIGCEKYEREITVSRIPNESVNVSVFQSDAAEPLSIKYYLDEKKQSFKMNLSFSFSHCKTIQDVVETTTIYNSFVDGKGYFLGKPFEAKLDDEAQHRFEDSSIIFWEKVQLIEAILDVHFIPPNEDVDFDTICLVEQLYQNLINHIPIRDKNKIDTIEGNWDYKQEKIKDSIGKPIFLEFDASFTIDLFGEKKSIPALLGIFNAILSECKTTGEKSKIKLEDESPEKPHYTSMLCFKNMEELEKCRKFEHTEIIKRMKDAQYAHCFLREVEKDS